MTSMVSETKRLVLNSMGLCPFPHPPTTHPMEEGALYDYNKFLSFLSLSLAFSASIIIVNHGYNCSLPLQVRLISYTKENLEDMALLYLKEMEKLRN
jgi:hypothetical protein